MPNWGGGLRGTNGGFGIYCVAHRFSGYKFQGAKYSDRAAYVLDFSFCFDQESRRPRRTEGQHADSSTDPKKKNIVVFILKYCVVNMFVLKKKKKKKVKVVVMSGCRAKCLGFCASAECMMSLKNTQADMIGSGYPTGLAL
jgi:hypothetical protein